MSVAPAGHQQQQSGRDEESSYEQVDSPVMYACSGASRSFASGMPRFGSPSFDLSAYQAQNAFEDWRQEEEFYSSNSSSCSSSISAGEEYLFFDQSLPAPDSGIPYTFECASNTNAHPYLSVVPQTNGQIYSAPIGSTSSLETSASLPATFNSPSSYDQPQPWQREAYRGPLGASLAVESGFETGAIDPHNLTPEIYELMTQQDQSLPDEEDAFDTIRDSAARSTYTPMLNSLFFEGSLAPSPNTSPREQSSPVATPAKRTVVVHLGSHSRSANDTIGRSATRSSKRPSQAKPKRSFPEASTLQALDLEGLQLTSQGTIRGHRMPVKGVNPSTTGCFMDLNENTPYHVMGTKRSRGRSPHTKAYLSMLLADPSRLGELIAIVGSTKAGKPKRFFPCPVEDCQAWFRRSEHSKRHIRSLHTDERPFICPEPSCGRLFTRVDNLNQHVRLKHPESDCVRKGIKPEKVKTRPLSSISKTVLRADSPTTSVSSRSSYESKGAIARTKGGLDSFSDEAEDDADDDYIP